MKTIFLIAVLILYCGQSSPAQPDSIVLKKFYHTWVMPEKGSRGKSGILYKITDSAVVVSNSPFRQSYASGNFDLTTLDIRNINAIKVRRQGKGFALLIGGVTGIVTGGFITATLSKHHTETIETGNDIFEGFMLKALPLFVSTGLGLAVGALLSSKITIPIKGSQSQFERNKRKLNDYALVNNPALKMVPDHSFSMLRESVFDADGNAYHLLALGGQVWMADDLKVKHYNDGSEIKGISDPEFRYLYTWHMVHDSLKLCPTGWHVPTIAEWTSFFNSLGGESEAGDKLHDRFTATNGTSHWWTSTETDSGNAQSLLLNNETAGVLFLTSSKNSVLKVRCIRD